VRRRTIRFGPMSVTVRVPTIFRPMTAGASKVTVDGGTVDEVLTSLETAHPGFRDKLLDGQGALVRSVNVYVDDDDVRFLDGLGTKVPDGGTLSIMPAVAGG
jgi:molybdopterin synthase sulfur carrier subunit